MEWNGHQHNNIMTDSEIEAKKKVELEHTECYNTVK